MAVPHIPAFEEIHPDNTPTDVLAQAVTIRQLQLVHTVRLVRLKTVNAPAPVIDFVVDLVMSGQRHGIRVGGTAVAVRAGSDAASGASGHPLQLHVSDNLWRDNRSRYGSHTVGCPWTT